MSDRDPPARPPKPPAASPASPAAPATPVAPATTAGSSGSAPHSSGRVQFDERGQAIWEWAVKTGMFDRNASTQRIRALVETPIELQIDEGPLPGTNTGRHEATSPGRESRPVGARPSSAEAGSRSTGPLPARPSGSAPASSGTPSGKPPAPPRTAAPTTPARPGVVPEPGESSGFDPYSRGPAKRPEAQSYNPYESGPKKR